MRLSIMQPAYLPWIGYFQRISMSDLHVVLDHVQIDRNSKTKFANRNRIRTPDGWTWLTVPLKTSNQGGALEINRIEIDNGQTWAPRHARALSHSYRRAPCFPQFGDALLSLYERPPGRLTELLESTTSLLLAEFGLGVPMRRSSELALRSTGSKLILEICQIMRADEYISGPFGREYLDLEAFDREGVKVMFHEYEPLPYPQNFAGFEPNLSAVDLLANLGKEAGAFLSFGAALKAK